MKGMIKKVFIEHPHSINESYFQHLFFAFKTSIKMLMTSLMLMTHALIPCLFKTTGSDFIINTYNTMTQRNKKRKN